MTTLLTPNTQSSTPNTKKSVFSSGSSSRRQSTSSVGGTSSTQIPQGIGYSPGPTGVNQSNSASPAGSGIPSFRTLRSLLPFGPSKNATPTSSSSPNTSSRSPFASFGSVRRSMNRERERKISLSNDATPVISINRSPLADDTAIRRSASLSKLEKPLPREPNFSEGSSNPFQNDSLRNSVSGYPLRTPSPGPPLSVELSTIIEADSSGVSKHVPFFGVDRAPGRSRSSSPPINPNFLPADPSSKPREESTLSKAATKGRRKPDFEFEGDTSALELPTEHLTDQVREAMLKSGSSPKDGKQWMEPVVIDGDEHPDIANASFNLDTVDPDLLALLSPNTGSKNASSSRANHQSSSPTTPTFPSSPASTSRPSRASSLLPRLRPSQISSSPTSPQFSIPTPSPTRTSPNSATTPKATSYQPRTPVIAVNGSDYSPPNELSTSTPARRTVPRLIRTFSPPSASTSGYSSNDSSRTTKMFSGLARSDAKTPPTNGSSRLVSRTLRQVMLGNSRSNDGSADLTSYAQSSPSFSTPAVGRGSLDSRRPPLSNAMKISEIGLGRPSLEIRRGNSFDSRVRPSQPLKEPTRLARSSASPEPTATQSTDIDSSPSPEKPYEDPHYRPSFDSSRPSFDTNSRPGSVARMRERERDRQQTPSLRVTDASVPVAGSARIRKRSMSVQERFPKARLMTEASTGSISRPGSSMSVHGARGIRGGDTEHEGSSVLGPRMEWLGPRTAKAFKAAGLLDFDREKERDRDAGEVVDPVRRLRSGSVGGGVPSPSPLGANSGSAGSLLAQNRFATIRSASEYNPTQGRAYSRMAFSEAGGVTSGHNGRRGSGTFSAYGGSVSAHGGGSAYGHAGLMESPTFTSSSSRERDTPKSSTSTAPTSLSESFGYLGRDRMDRDREEIRELKERHGTEMGALLNALSDSQRTVRMLREENSQLRERLDRFAAVGRENEDLRHTCEVLEGECLGLRRDYSDLQRELASLRVARASSGLTASWSQSSTSSSGLRTPITKPGNSSPLAVDATPQFLRHQQDADQYSDTIIIHDTMDDGYGFNLPSETDINAPRQSNGVNATSSATPSLKRRLSNTSSIFPIPPANMTMLLHEDSTQNVGEIGDGNRSSADTSQFHFSFHSQSTSKPIPTPRSRSHSRSVSKSPSITYRNFAGPSHYANKSITSQTSISPTTANFSMATGSPGSLFLRPEHELLLGDMESLDLGANDVDVDSAMSKLADNDGW
ncbi:hypothetical protein BDN70DRAFT_920101 [Pholiota conissans]|uniref:Uncharacterized protein n=1 Tax=Pholiota conissans TaxID=109636 RepID=A0A9P5Z4U5_9AGAR|nr:hypothetical protein BDN70DRAFT_920101 [Pholiota conissans]